MHRAAHVHAVGAHCCPQRLRGMVPAGRRDETTMRRERLGDQVHTTGRSRVHPESRDIDGDLSEVSRGAPEEDEPVVRHCGHRRRHGGGSIPYPAVLPTAES